MKPVRKDGKRQARRERTLARLEQYLEGGVKKQLDRIGEVGSKFAPDRGLKKFYKKVAFEQSDVDRIRYDIKVLKERLGKAA